MSFADQVYKNRFIDKNYLYIIFLQLGDDRVLPRNSVLIIDFATNASEWNSVEVNICIAIDAITNIVLSLSNIYLYLIW